MPFKAFSAVSILIALLSFAFAAWLYGWVKQPVSNEHIIQVGGLIRRGATPSLQRNIWFSQSLSASPPFDIPVSRVRYGKTIS